jgi:hypothetical protein
MPNIHRARKHVQADKWGIKFMLWIVWTELSRVLPVLAGVHHSAKKATTRQKKPIKVLIFTMKLWKLALFAQI